MADIPGDKGSHDKDHPGTDARIMTAGNATDMTGQDTPPDRAFPDDPNPDHLAGRAAALPSRAVPTGRFARFTRLGGLATGLAGQAAAGRARAAFRREPADMAAVLLTPANITRITTRLAEMRGAAMKLGQLLSMESGDVLPPELSNILARLRADADAMPPKQLKAVRHCRLW